MLRLALGIRRLGTRALLAFTLLLLSLPLAATVAAAPVISFSPSSITFPTTMVGQTSGAQSITVTNTGDTNLTISGVFLANATDFSGSSNCGGAVLAPGSNCVVQVQFQPQSGGNKTGSVQFNDDAAGSPHAVPLSGFARTPTPAVELSPTSLTFARQTANTQSAPQYVTLRNTGDGTLNITSITISSEFQESHTCGSTVAPGGSCTFTVYFYPTGAGARSGALTITSDAPGSPHTVALSGTGVAPPVALTNWQSLGGALTDAPGLVSLNGRLFVLAPGADHQLYIKSSVDGVNYTEWQPVGGVLTSAAAGAQQGNELLLFARGLDNALYVMSSTDGQTFSGWRRVGGELSSAPAAVHFNGRTYVYARGNGNHLYVTSTADGVNFTDWSNLGGELSDPAAVAVAENNQLFVFVRGINGDVFVTQSSDGRAYSQWRNLGGPTNSGPAAAGYNGQVYVFVRGADNQLYEQHSADGITWSDWTGSGGVLASAPAAASFFGGNSMTARLVVVVVGVDRAVYERHTP